MATVTTTARSRQATLLDPEPPPPGGFKRPGKAVAAPPVAPAPRRQTLEDRVAAAWTGLTTSHTASCLLCGGDVAPRYSAGARPVGGRCTSCGTEIS